MVSSGLSELTSVSQYRLATHLGAAAVLFLALIWVARGLEPEVSGQVRPGRGWVVATWALLGLLFVQIIAGAFVAGLNAGGSHNTWPLMDGQILPTGLFGLEPLWRNFFEDVMTVQFNHRNLAYVITVTVGVTWWLGRREPGYSGVHGWMPRIALITLLQVILGIATLLTVVNIPLALGHQALAFMLIGMIVAYLADMQRLS